VAAGGVELMIFGGWDGLPDKNHACGPTATEQFGGVVEALRLRSGPVWFCVAGKGTVNPPAPADPL